MRYLKVLWSHDLSEEPVELYSELDDAGYEIRKVEIYRDGRRDFADGESSSGATMLGEGPLPSLEEIAEQEEFSPSLIEVADFERIWRQAVGGSNNS
ncbi:DUF6881 domain-containing protein [Streptomyces naphthomycinicus]|uniref:DUF6881 domain-containing protein n=1 Tax=Streptomyces naphthomycinicus TaxID=2872625 RepID=UPI001CED2F33|nr:hypothetical protein [Streptomyces sp. TML10]